MISLVLYSNILFLYQEMFKIASKRSHFTSESYTGTSKAEHDHQPNSSHVPT